MSKEIEAGDWIDTKNYGEAVCTYVYKDYVQLRYKATRNSDKKEIWVENAESKENVKFVRPTDEIAQYVLTLEGAYGESQKKIPVKPKM